MGLSLEIPLDTATAAARLARLGGARVVLNLSPFTDGVDEILGYTDVLIVNEHEAEELQAYAGVENDTAVDTTGCGDAFLGAMLVSLAEGQDLEHAARFASRAAAFAAERHGAQPSYPTREAIEPSR